MAATASTPEKALYEVVTGFWFAHAWQVPGATLRLTEREARYLLLGGNIKKKSATPPA